MSIKIGIVGSVEAGKTVYLATLLRLLLDGQRDDLTSSNLNAIVDEEDTQRFWTEYHAFLNERGQWPPHNAPGYHKAIRFDLTDGASRNQIVEFQDLAGEDVVKFLKDDGNREDLAALRQWYEKCAAFMFLIPTTNDLTQCLQSVDELIVPVEDPQRFFAHRLILQLCKNAEKNAKNTEKNAKVRQPVAFVFTRADMVEDARDRPGDLARKLLHQPELIVRRFESYEFFACSSTGSLDRTDPEHPRPLKGGLRPFNVIEPLDWVVAQLEARQEQERQAQVESQKARALARRRARRQRLVATVVVAALAAGGFGGTVCYRNDQLLRQAEELVADARQSEVDVRGKTNEAQQLVAKIRGPWPSGARRAALSQKVSELLAAQDVRDLTTIVLRLRSTVGGAENANPDGAAVVDDLANAAALYRRASGASPGTLGAVERRQLDEAGRELASEFEPSLRAVLAVPSRRRIRAAVQAVDQWLSIPGRSRDESEPYVKLLALTLVSLPPAQVIGNDDLFDASPELCKSVYQTLCERYVDVADSDAPADPHDTRSRPGTRKVLLEVLNSMGARSKAAVGMHALHLQAAVMLDDVDAVARTPAALGQLDSAYEPFSSHRDATSDLLRARAIGLSVQIIGSLLDQAVQQSASAPGDAVASLAVVSHAVQTSPLFDDPAARQKVGMRIQSIIRGLPSVDVDKPDIRGFCLAMSQCVRGDDESPVLEVLADRLGAEHRYATSVAFVKSLAPLAWRDTRVASITAAAGQFVDSISTRYAGEVGHKPNATSARTDPDAFLSALDALHACALDIHKHETDAMPEFGRLQAAVAELESALLTSGDPTAATPDGSKAFAAALEACMQGDAGRTDDLLRALSRFDQIQLARPIEEVRTKLLPQIAALQESTKLAVRSERMTACIRIAQGIAAARFEHPAVAGVARELSNQALRRVSDDLASLRKEFAAALDGGNLSAAALDELTQGAWTDGLRRLDAAAYDVAMAAASVELTRSLGARSGPLGAAERSLALAGTVRLPLRRDLLRAVSSRYGATADGILASMRFADEAAATITRLAADGSEAWTLALTNMQAASGELRESALAAVEAYARQYAPGGHADDDLIKRRCFGKAHKVDFLKTHQTVVSLVASAKAHGWYTPAAEEKVTAQVSEIGGNAEAAPSSLPLFVRRQQVGSFAYVSITTTDSSEAPALPILPFIEGNARYDSTAKAVAEFIRRASAAGSFKEIDELLSVEASPEQAGEFVVKLKDYPDPVFRIDRDATTAFAYIYGDVQRRRRPGVYTAQAIAQWYRLLLYDTFKVVCCFSEPSPSAPARLQQAWGDLRQLGPDIDPEAARKAIAHYAGKPELTEFDLPAAAP